MDIAAHIDSQLATAALRVNVALERSALKALRSLGLPGDSEDLEAAERRLVGESPRYVAQIILKGTMSREMYDEHPGYAYFSTDSWQTTAAPRCCGLSQAVDLALALFEKAKAEYDAAEEEYDGLFCPVSILLKDQFGDTVQEYAHRYDETGSATDWLTGLPPPSEWEAILAKADALDVEGAFESSWDNFETGRGLRAQADELRRRVEIARTHCRLVP